MSDWVVKEKVCLVTGATDGMGYEIAKALAVEGAHVIAVARNPEKGKRVVEEIRRVAGHEKVDLLICDLSSQSDIRHLADQINTTYPALHVLVNNAGGYFSPRQETVDGIEYTWALNHLAYFLLTNLLLDKLKSSTPARIINVSSIGHKIKTHFDDIEYKTKRYSTGRAYQKSKMANVMFTFSLAKKLEGSGISVNVLHPGWVNSAFGRSAGGLFNKLLFFVLRNTVMVDAAQGAKTAIYLASSPEVEGITGEYWAYCKIARPMQWSKNTDVQDSLWQLCEEMTNMS